MNGNSIAGGSSVVGMLTDWIDLISYLKDFLHIDIKNPEFMEKIILFIAIGVLILVVVNRFIKKQRELKLCNAGTRGIPCKVDQYKIFKSKDKAEDILNRLHRDLYHCVHCIKQKIKKLDTKSYTHAIRIEDIPDIKLLLQHFHATLYNVFNIDTSISIYSTSTTSDNQIMLTRDMFLGSKEEEKMQNRRILTNKYLAAKAPKHSMEELTLKAERYFRKHGCETFHKNSVFDFILSNSHNSWLSNDLEVDSKRQLFFTTSENYKVFYNSLAAFAILPPECNENRDTAIKGILTFDTMETGMFLEKECITIMGLMAHLVNEIIDFQKQHYYGN